eukprot:SAG25_NODE_9774_length_358_cov_1.285714_1_plen_58_part_01
MRTRCAVGAVALVGALVGGPQRATGMAGGNGGGCSVNTVPDKDWVWTPGSDCRPDPET